MGDTAERQHHNRGTSLMWGPARQFVEQKGAAGVDFGADRFVGWWDATNGVGNSTIDQVDAVVGRSFVGPACETVFEQCRIKKVTGIVAGERPTGSIGASQTRRKADDQQPRIVGSERAHRRVVPGGIGSLVITPESDQTGTMGAG